MNIYHIYEYIHICSMDNRVDFVQTLCNFNKINKNTEKYSKTRYLIDNLTVKNSKNSIKIQS